MSATDWSEAHQREALRRTYELAAELVAADRPRDGAWVASSAVTCIKSEDDWRFFLGLARDGAVPPFDLSRIDREVAMVRERAERACLASRLAEAGIGPDDMVAGSRKEVAMGEGTTAAPPTAACDGCEFVFGEGHLTPPCKHQMLLTREEIDAIRARNAARTPGKWWPGDGVIHTANTRIAVVTDKGEPWAPAEPEADADFIAAASEDIPRLLATLDARDAEVAKLRRALEGVLAVCRDRAAFVAQGPRSFARAEQIAVKALGSWTDPSG